MPTINPALHSPITFGDNGVVNISQWTPVLAGDDCEPIHAPGANERSIHVSGVFGAVGKITILGTNEELDETPDWQVLTDPHGVPLEFTTGGLKNVGQITQYLKPAVSGGDGTTSLKITAVAKR